MNPAEVRACTARELHHFLQAWIDKQEPAPTFQEWDD